MHKLNPRTAALLSAFGWAVGYLLAGKVLAVLLPDRAYNWLMRYERYGMILLLVLVATGVLGKPLTTVTEAAFDKLFVFAEWGYELIGIFG